MAAAVLVACDSPKDTADDWIEIVLALVVAAVAFPILDTIVCESIGFVP